MEDTKQKLAKENKMGTRPMLPLIITMALPTMFSMLVQALYNVVDSYFVAQVSEDSLTAVSLVFPIQTLLIAFAVGTGVGINSLVARRLGEKRQEEADNAATHGLVLGAINWVLFALVGIFGSQPFIGAFTSEAGLLQLGVDYMSIVCIFSFGVFIEVNIEKTLQATGNMIFPMIFQLVGAVTNIILDPIFIFVLDMGVAGAAIATVISQIASCAYVLWFLLRGSVLVPITFGGYDLKIIGRVTAIGMSSFLIILFDNVMLIALNMMLQRYGGAGYGEQDTNVEMRAAKNYIDTGHYAEAINALNSVPPGQRNARWYYLNALAQAGLHNNAQAMEYARQAVNMEPGNILYQQLLSQLQSGGSWYEQRGQGYGRQTFGGSNFCCSLMALELCCMCCGGGRMMYYPLFCCC